jgi:hypothetical protein
MTVCQECFEGALCIWVKTEWIGNLPVVACKAGTFGAGEKWPNLLGKAFHENLLIGRGKKSRLRVDGLLRDGVWLRRAWQPGSGSQK